jgi:hypothetical protein
MKIQQYKMQKIADRLSADKKLKADELETAAVNAATKFISDQIPDEVKEFFAKWPKVGKYDTHYVRIGSSFNGLGYYTKSLAGAKALPITRNVSEDSPEAKLFNKATTARKVADETHNRVICALMKIQTYAKLKNEWPEAYAILCEIDGTADKAAKEACICDDVEKLRAELNQKTK